MIKTAASLLEQQLREALGWQYGVLCGRGTTALWLALRAIRRRDGPGEVILPDLLCSTAMDGVLLAGFMPVFANVLPGRFTLSPESVAQCVTPRTRAIVAAHLFGHIAELDLIRQAAPGIPLIEDAVQGFGGSYNGRPVGTWGDLSFTSFDRSKMIGGRGGALFFDDHALLDGILVDLHLLPELPDLRFNALDALLPPAAANGYAFQLQAAAPGLLRPFDPSPANLDRIQAGWETLGARIEARNAKAHWLNAHLPDLPLVLPDLHAGDAIWRYTITAPSVVVARRIVHDMQAAGLSGSALYYPLSRFFGQPARIPDVAGRLLNLPVDEVATNDVLQRTAEVLAAVPWREIARAPMEPNS